MHHLRLPQNKNVQMQWIQFARDNGVHDSSLKPSTSLFCSAHFSDSSFYRYTNTTHLKSDAYPTIMLKRVKCVSVLAQYCKLHFIIL